MDPNASRRVMSDVSVVTDRRGRAHSGLRAVFCMTDYFERFQNMLVIVFHDLTQSRADHNQRIEAKVNSL